MYPIYEQLRKRHVTSNGNGSANGSESAGRKQGNQGNISSGADQGGAGAGGTPGAGNETIKAIAVLLAGENRMRMIALNVRVCLFLGLT